MPNLRDFERRLGGLVEGLFSKAFRSGLQPVEIAKRIIRTMDEGKQVGMNEVWAPNHFEVSLASDDAPRFTPIEAALTTELQRVVMDTAAERGWGLVGPPEVTLFVDADLRKGDLEVEASLVEGERKVEPVAAARPHLLVHAGGTVRRCAAHGERHHDRTPAGVRRGRGRQGRLAPARADPDAGRASHDHRSRIDERHEPERSRRRVAHAGGRRPDHDRRDADRVPGA